MRRSLMVKLHYLFVFNIIWTAETSKMNKSTINNAAVLEEESGTIHCNELKEKKLRDLLTERHMEQTDRFNENEDGDKSHADGNTDSVSIELIEASDKSNSSNAGKVSTLDDHCSNLQNDPNCNLPAFVDAHLSNVKNESLLSNSLKIENIGEKTPQSNDFKETNKTDISDSEQMDVNAIITTVDIIENPTILEHTVLEKDEKNKQNKDADNLEQISLEKVKPKSNDLVILQDLGPDENGNQPLETHSSEKMQTLEVLEKNESPSDNINETPSDNLNDEQSTNFSSADNEPKQYTESTHVKANNDNEDQIENENINVGSACLDIQTNIKDLNLEVNNQQEDQSKESKECKGGSKNAESNKLEGKNKTDPNIIFLNEENVNDQERDQNNKTYNTDDIMNDVETKDIKNDDNDLIENIVIIDEHGTIHSKIEEEKSEANYNNNNNSEYQEYNENFDYILCSSDDEFFIGSYSQTDEEYFSTDDDERKQEKTTKNYKNFNTDKIDNKGNKNRKFKQPKQPKEKQKSKKNMKEIESELFNNEEEKNNFNFEKKPDQIYKTTFLENMRNRFNNWLYKIKNTIFPEKITNFYNEIKKKNITNFYNEIKKKNITNFYNEIKKKKFFKNLYMGKVVTLDNYKINAIYSFTISNTLSKIWVNPDFEITFLNEKPPALGIWSKKMYNDLSCKEKLHLGTKYQNYTNIFELVAKICSINVNRLDFYSSINKNTKISSFIDNNMIIDQYLNCNQIYGYVFFNNISLVFADTKQGITSEVYFSPKQGYCYRDPINDNVYYLDLKHDLVECLIETSLIEQYKTGEPDKILCVRVFSSTNQFYVPSMMSLKEISDKLVVDQSRMVRNEPNIYKKIGQANLKPDTMNHINKAKNDEKKSNKNKEKSYHVNRKHIANCKSDLNNLKGKDNSPKRKPYNDKVPIINKSKSVYEVDTAIFKTNGSNTNEKKENLSVINNNEENNSKPQEVKISSLNTLNAKNIQNDVSNNENKIDNIHEKLSEEIVDSNLENSQIKAMYNELEKFKYLLEENETRIADNLVNARTLVDNNSIKDDLTSKIVFEKDKNDIKKVENKFNRDAFKNKDDKNVPFLILPPEIPIKKHMVPRGRDQYKTGNTDTAKNIGLINDKRIRDLDPSQSNINKKDNLAAKKESKDSIIEQKNSDIKNVETTFWTRKNKIIFVLCVIMILSAVGIGLYFYFNK